MNRPEPRRFRSMTVNMGTRKMRTMIITLSLSVAVLLLLVSVVAAQLMASRGTNSVASRMLYSVSNQSLNSIMGREIPLYASADPNLLGQHLKEPRSNLTSMLFYLFTDIDIEHPISLLSGQISAMAVSNFEPLTEDSETIHGDDTLPVQPDQTKPPVKEPEPSPVQSDGKPLVFIYQTHNRESFLPELKDKGYTELEQAYDKDKNMVLVGERLFNGLKKNQINAIQTKNDYWYKGDVKNEYDLSRKTAQEILTKNDSIKMVFDLHRDSLPRKYTTTQWNGQDVAKVSLIVGGSNPNLAKNEAFAKRIHNKFNQMYPGLSRGAFKKQPPKEEGVWYDTRYNQDLNPNSLIIEIGGPENTLAETYRTADLLANVIAEIAKEDGYIAKSP